jgi:hypothetical protein
MTNSGNSADDNKNAEKHRHGYQGYDPLQAVRTQSSAFNVAWLKNGESLSVFQRTGVTIFSLLFVGIGLYLSGFALMFLREGNFMLLLFGVASLFFLSFGVLGLRNALRFKRNESMK